MFLIEYGRWLLFLPCQEILSFPIILEDLALSANVAMTFLPLFKLYKPDAERTDSVEQITKRVQMTVLINITLQAPGK